MITKNYNRPIAADPTLITPIDLTFPVGAEVDDTFVQFLQADADESGGTIIKDLYRIIYTPVLELDGAMLLKVNVIPVDGFGDDLPNTEIYVDHPENMDTWQTEAGRLRRSLISEGTIEDHPASYAVQVGDDKKIFSNIGAGGPIVFTLPPAVKNLSYKFMQIDPFKVSVIPDGAEVIHWGSLAPTAELFVDEIYSTLCIRCPRDGEWMVSEAPIGNWIPV